MKICWQMQTPADSVLEWNQENSLSVNFLQVTSVAKDDLTCAILKDLLPSTRYMYRILSQGAEFSSNFVSLKSANENTLTFWVYGDSRSGPEIRDQIDAAILRSVAAEPSSQTLLISTGDLMDEASEESLQENEFAAGQPDSLQILSQLPIVNVMGNHDGTKLFLKYFPYPYTDSFDWSFDDGPVHFVVIDQYYGGDENAPRWQWLRNDLAHSDKVWKIILLHEPGWSAGPHANNSDVQQIIHPIAVKDGVSLVFAGHNHYYARAEVDGVTYITTGGAGAPLYDPEHGYPHILFTDKENHYIQVMVKGQELTLTVLTPQGKIIEQINLKK
jgi:predicted phosphodiesterase